MILLPSTLDDADNPGTPHWKVLWPQLKKCEAMKIFIPLSELKTLVCMHCQIRVDALSQE